MPSNGLRTNWIFTSTTNFTSVGRQTKWISRPRQCESVYASASTKLRVGESVFVLVLVFGIGIGIGIGIGVRIPFALGSKTECDFFVWI